MSEKILFIFAAITGLIAALFAIIDHFLDESSWIRKLIKKVPHKNKLILGTILVSIIVITSIIGYNLGRSKKTRICLLLPLNEEIKAAYDDGIKQVSGLVEFFVRNPDTAQKFEFVIRDHSMSDQVAETIIKDEINHGTKYFVCTMSKVVLPLSIKFENLLKDTKWYGEKPKLICTVTSAPKLNFVKNGVYRFYIRSQEEGAIFAELVNSNSIKSATFIAVDDPYGRGAVEEFKKRCKCIFADGAFISNKLTIEEITFRLKQTIEQIPPERREAIFIAHYGIGIDNIITSLQKLGITSTILATSTLSIEDWRKPIKNILDSIDWYTCMPNYNNTEANRNDVVKDFTYFTIDRLTKTILENKSDFDAIWKTVNIPNNLQVNWEDSGDAIIPMKIVHKSFFAPITK